MRANSKTKMNMIKSDIISGCLDSFVFYRWRAKRERAALYKGGVAFVSPSPDPRPVRPEIVLRVAALCCLCLVFVGGSASAQDGTPTGLERSAEGALATRIEADEQTGTIRIIIDGEARAIFDANGLHVDGNVTYTGTLTDISDHRLKADIRRLPPQSENIAALDPVAFSMADDPARRTEYGVIAQEMEAVYPALVETRSGGTKAVNYTGLIAPLVSAVQELQADNARLRARIEALETGADRAPAQAGAR